MLQIAHDTLYAHPLPEGHRFPMAKYELIPEQLLHEGRITRAQLHQPEKVALEHALAVHDVRYVRRLLNLELERKEVRAIGFPLSRELVNRELTITQGTIDNVNYALENGAAMNVAGGTHHAYTDRGEGFCLLNDQAIAAKYLIDHTRVQRVLILDLDVHQGQGTAQIFEGYDPVFTFSMHGKDNYPLRKERSDWDIPLASGTEDDQYLSELQAVLAVLFDRARPDFVFYLSGVDVLASDKLGRLALSPAGCAERDRMVVEAVAAKGLPLQVSMGGGYSERLATIVDAHCETFKIVQDVYYS